LTTWQADITSHHQNRTQLKRTFISDTTAGAMGVYK
jgi:hypothetical protein